MNKGGAMQGKTMIPNSRIILSILPFYFLLFTFIPGCAMVKEQAKKVMGVSTAELEKARKNAIIKDMPHDYFTVYTKTLDILKELNVYIYEQNIKKHMIAMYISQEDTTPVGLFFKEVDVNNTRIEFSSPSTYAKEYVAGKISSAFQELNKPVEKGEQADAQEKIADK